MRYRFIAGFLAIALAACATPPQRSEQLEQARTEIDTLSQDPLGQQAGGKDLEAARRRLGEAETALHNREPPAIVDHLAYLAYRHAQAGEARASEAHARQEVARAQTDRDRILMESRSREAEVARSQAEAAKNEAQAAQAQLASTQQQLADLQARKTDRGMVVTLGDVLFDTGQATLKPGAQLSMDRLAAYLSANPQTRVLIEGYTDSRGSSEYNDALSERRANAVAKELMARGISADAVQTIGRGKAYPVASNDTPEGRQQNRRVEIVFSDASGHFAQADPTAIQR